MTKESIQHHVRDTKHFNVVDPIEFASNVITDFKPYLVGERITYSSTEKRQIITYKGKELYNELILDR